MAKKAIGPSFSYELAAAGLLGLPFTWTSDGNISFEEGVTPQQKAAIVVVYDAHNPARPDPAGVKAELAELDAKSIRALHEAMLELIANGLALPPTTVQRLKELEDQKAALRSQLPS